MIVSDIFHSMAGPTGTAKHHSGEGESHTPHECRNRLRRVSLLVPCFTLVLSVCQPTPSAPAANVSREPPLAVRQAITLTVTLVEATQRPTPVGLPTEFAIVAPAFPEPGAEVDVTWRALDGDVDKEPRDGPGLLQVSADGAQATIVLRGPGTAAENPEALTLIGTTDASEIRGTFADRLFFLRAGTFVAPIGEP